MKTEAEIKQELEAVIRSTDLDPDALGTEWYKHEVDTAVARLYEIVHQRELGIATRIMQLVEDGRRCDVHEILSDFSTYAKQLKGEI